MKLHLPLAFATFARHSFAEPALRGQEQESSSVSRSLATGFSSVGTGLCSDYYGKNYDRATFSGIDTKVSCERTCAPIERHPLGGNSKLVGYDYSDTLNICSCRFTEGYINTSQLGGVGNCPSGAYADWGGEACKVVPLTQGGSGVGKVTQAGGDSRYACFRNEKFSGFFSSVGTGLCSDYYSKYYDRATFSGIDTRDSCESTCVPLGDKYEPHGKHSKLVGYEYSDTLNICSCRFTEGYINTSNCPSGAYADWGGEACKVVPLTQGGSGVGKVTQAGGDSRYACFRNENFSICRGFPYGTYVMNGYRYGCPDNDEMVTELRQIGYDLYPCEHWCIDQGVGCCSWSRDFVGGHHDCTWKGYANAPVSLVDTNHWNDYAGLICD